MTKEEIIEMAHKSGLHLATDVNWMPIIGLEYLEKFAKLVTEKERDACAQLAVDAIAFNGGTVQMESHVRQAIEARGEE